MLTINGVTFEVPGVYGGTEVMNFGSVSLPEFNGLLTIGNARQGIPYNAGAGNIVFKGFSDVAAAKKYFGTCELTKAFEQNKIGGAGVGFLSTPAQLTQAKCPVKDSTAETPLTIFEIASAIYGSIGNDIHLTFTKTSNSLAITIVPVKVCKHITADIAASTKVLSLEDVEGLQLGEDVIVEDDGNTTNYVNAKTIYIDSVNNRITIDTAITSLTKANYGRVFTQDTVNKLSKTFDLTSVTVLDDVIGWINASGVVKCTRGDNTGDITTIANLTNYIGAVTGATKGVSPNATTSVGGDFDTFASVLPQKIEEFRNVAKARLRIINVVCPVSTVHTAFKSAAITLRAQQSSVQIVSGVGKTTGTLDENLTESDNNHPFVRTRALNTDEFILASMGLDDKEAYLTLGPQVAGIMSANSAKRNLTSDTISATKVNKFFGESNKETETKKWLRNGCLIVGTGEDGFSIVRGINTYLKQATEWNKEDNKTYLIQQRQEADYVFEGYRKQMKEGAGADSYNEIIASSQGIDILKKYYAAGYVTKYRIAEAYSDGDAVVTVPSVLLNEGKDFVGYVLRIEN